MAVFTWTRLSVRPSTWRTSSLYSSETLRTARRRLPSLIWSLTSTKVAFGGKAVLSPGPCPPLPSGPAGLTRDGRAESGAKQAFDLEGQSAQRVVGTIMQYSRQLEMKAQLAEAGLDKTKLATVHK